MYRGPIDDRLTYEKQKPVASENYLRDALDAQLAGEPIAVPVRDALVGGSSVVAGRNNFV